MSDIMMRLGSFGFGITTAAYQELQRRTAYKWASNERFGKDDALQATGYGADTISLPGVVYPEFFSGTEQLNDLRSLAEQLEPQTLIDGRGNMLGQWVIEEVEERGTIFGPQGVALKQEFTLSLRRYQDDGQDVGGVIDVITSAIPVPSTLSSATQAASSAAKGTTSLVSSLTSSLATITGMAGVIGSQASSINAAVRNGLNTAKRLQNAGSDAARMLGGVKSIASIPSAMNSLVHVGAEVSRAAGASSSVLKLANIADPTAASAVRNAMIDINRVNVLAVSVRTSAQSVLTKIG